MQSTRREQGTLQEAPLNRLACPCCHLDRTTPQLAAALRALWRLTGGGLVVTSGTRCPAHNRAVGGVAHSRHLIGRAVDLACLPAAQLRLCELALKAGFVRALPGAPRGYVHLDL